MPFENVSEVVRHRMSRIRKTDTKPGVDEDLLLIGAILALAAVALLIFWMLF
jgi:hypothetical protein